MVKIVADTTSSIPVEEAKKLGLAYLPQIIMFGEESYRDDTELDTNQFLTKLRASSTLPKTAAPPPNLYNPIYEEAVKAGETVLVVCPSAQLSGTVRSATVAAQDFPGADIRVIDTLAVAGGLSVMVRKAHEWAQAGVDADTIVARLDEMGKRQRTYFLVDTLEYLHKGGRIGGAQALLGSLLQVKPILMLKDGKIDAAESQRTKKRAMNRLIELVKEGCADSEECYVTIMQADAKVDADCLASELGAMLHVDNVPVYTLPPAIVVHAGPGALAVSFFTKKSA